MNLSWALNRMKQAALQNKQRSMPEIKAALIAEANAIRDEDISCCRAIGEAGLPLLENCQSVLTHCNAGQLAAVQYGTALAPIYLAQERGHSLHVFADETRPLLQGARLTAWELQQAGLAGPSGRCYRGGGPDCRQRRCGQQNRHQRLGGAGPAF